MSAGLDLTAAIEAGRAGIEQRLTWPSIHWRTADVDPAAFEPMAAAAIEAALPHVREQLAQQVDDHAREDFQIAVRRGDGSLSLRLAAFQQAARIVRGLS